MQETVERSAGDVIARECEVIKVHVGELKQLFNTFDSSPFRERDLDPDAEEFILGWARGAARKPLALLVQLDRPAGRADEPAALRDAIHEFFRYRAATSRQKVTQLFHVGRISLLIGLAFLTAGLGLARALANKPFGDLLHESLAIGGWVAMWRPLEIFLYDWWPIAADARLFDRLGAMPVRIDYGEGAGAGAESWRQDWPAVPARSRSAAGG